MARLNSILESEDYSEFANFLESLDDVNRFILNDERTKLGVVHILAGKPETEFTKSCFYNILRRPGLKINKTATIQGCYNITTAHIAVKFQNLQTLRMLIDSGCDLLISDAYGKNVEDYAEKYGNEEIKKAVQFGVKKWCESGQKSCSSHSNEQPPWEEWKIPANAAAASPTKVRFADDVRDKHNNPNDSISSTAAVAGTPATHRGHLFGRPAYEGKTKHYGDRQESSDNNWSGAHHNNKTTSNFDWASSGNNAQHNYDDQHKNVDTNSKNNNNNAFSNVDWTSSGNAQHNSGDTNWNSSGNNAQHNYDDRHKNVDTNWSSSHNSNNNNAFTNVDWASSGNAQHNSGDTNWNSSHHNSNNNNAFANFDWASSGNAQHNSGDANWSSSHHNSNNNNSNAFANFDWASSGNAQHDHGDRQESNHANWNDPHQDNNAFSNFDWTNSNNNNPQADDNNQFNYGYNNFDNQRTSYDYNDQNYNKNQGDDNFNKESTNHAYDDHHHNYINSCHGQHYHAYKQDNDKKDSFKLDSHDKQQDAGGYFGSCAGYFSGHDNHYDKKDNSEHDHHHFGHQEQFEQGNEFTFRNCPDPHNQAFNAGLNDTLRSNAHNDTIYLDAEDKRLNQTFIKEMPSPPPPSYAYDKPKENSFDSHISTRSIYTDPEDHTVKLVQEHYAGSCILQDKTKERHSTGGGGDFEQCFGLGDDTIIQDSDNFNDSNQSIATAVDELILKMTNIQVHDALRREGFNPGPVTDKTRPLYDRKLNRVQRSKRADENLRNELCEQVQHNMSSAASKAFRKLANYPLELGKLISRDFPFEEAIRLENQMIEKFRYSEKPRTFFTYLLLDPDTADGLPQKANELFKRSLPSGQLELFDPELFVAFILAIFYVGKGNNNRAYHHFNEAFLYISGRMKPTKGTSRMLTHWKDNKSPISAKTQRIVEIWSREGQGAISLHCFNGLTSDEALAREALIIEVLSVSNLTNINCGQNLDQLNFNKRERSILGTYLLFKAFIILLLNGECQILKPANS